MSFTTINQIVSSPKDDNSPPQADGKLDGVSQSTKHFWNCRTEKNKDKMIDQIKLAKDKIYTLDVWLTQQLQWRHQLWKWS